MVYLWIKSFHVLFVIVWMAAVFALPQILVNLAEVEDEPHTKARLILMGRRLYRLGHNVFGVVFALGLFLWQGWRLFPATLPNVTDGQYWIYAKLVMVALLLIHFIWAGRMIKRCEKTGNLPSKKILYWVNKLPVPLLFGAIFLVLVKPF